MARFEPRAGLDEEIALRVGKPAINRVLDMLQDASRRGAPPVKVWVTMRDERVRPSHFEADTQAVPANLRFKLRSADGVGWDHGRFPRDPDLPIGNRINCRCDAPEIENLLRDTIVSTGAQVRGTRVEGSVETRFPRAAESEFGTSQDTAAHFMTNALREVALRLNQGHVR